MAYNTSLRTLTISGSGTPTTLEAVGGIFSGDLSVSGTLIPAGDLTATNISGSGTLQMVGATTLGNALNVSGNVLLKDDATIGGASTGDLLTIGDGLLTVGGMIRGLDAISGSSLVVCTDLSASGQFHVSGNVGIKTDTPLYDLHINGAGSTIATIDGGSGGDAYLRFNTNGVEKAYIKQGSGGNTIITNDVAAKNLQLQARAAAGSATTYLFLDGGSESILMTQPVSASSTLYHAGAATFSDTLATTGSITAGSTITAGGNVLPLNDNSQDLGSGAKRWANIYTGDLHLKNDRGDWSVVEEEEYLSVINNKTGKKYKFVLEEIED